MVGTFPTTNMQSLTFTAKTQDVPFSTTNAFPPRLRYPISQLLSANRVTTMDVQRIIVLQHIAIIPVQSLPITVHSAILILWRTLISRAFVGMSEGPLSIPIRIRANHGDRHLAAWSW